MNYPLGHHTEELDRLNAQAMLLHDVYLDQLAAQSTSCLEIGCGNGANFFILQRANPQLHYMGIDIAAEAISAAKLRTHSYPNATFKVMDGQSIDLPQRFDLIFTKLVLWSTGNNLKLILNEVKRLLAPGGVFYALEPCNQLIQFYPPKPLASAWMKAWDAAVIQQGLNTHIGLTLAHELIQAGFNQVDTHFFPVSASSVNSLRYAAIINNLKGFYMGQAVNHLGLSTNESLKQQALFELDDMTPTSFVMDALFSVYGRII